MYSPGNRNVYPKKFVFHEQPLKIEEQMIFCLCEPCPSSLLQEVY